ncbi:MAG: toprim domain-containing protein, partial [Halieaceae bacterium]|jgi:hypothetical protein|nr:toprim domain-containing protein [Halieaceae bacterium]
MLDRASPASLDHPYLLSKQVTPYGLMQLDDMLLVPLRNGTGDVRSIQRIRPNGDKLFLEGGEVSGCFHLIGDALASPVYLVEGYATGATVNALTGRPVVVAFNTGNLPKVIGALRGSGYRGRIIIAADNDRETAGNPGISAAGKAAAESPDVSVVVPEFPADDNDGTDFNDLYVRHGREATLACLLAAEDAARSDDDAWRIQLAIANGTATVTEKDSRIDRACPVGPIEDMTRWICSATGAASGIAPRMAALAVAALAASRRYETPQGDGLHLHQLVSMQSASEMAPLFNEVSRILAAAGIRKMVCEQRLSAAASFYHALYLTPAMLYMTPDWGRRFFGPQHASIEHVGILMGQSFNRGSWVLNSPGEAWLKKDDLNDDEQPVIQKPAFNLLAFSAESDIGNVFSDSQMGRGLIETLLFARVAIDYIQEAAEGDPPDWLLQRIREIRGLPEHHRDFNQETLFGENSLLAPPLRRVEFVEPPSSRYAALLALSDAPHHRPILQASRGLMRRVAAILAVWQQPRMPVVTPAMLDWALDFVRGSTIEILRASQAGQGEDGRSSAYEKVLAVISKAGSEGVRHRDLLSSCKPYRNLKKDDRGFLLQQMVEDGEIIAYPGKRNTWVLASLLSVSAGEGDTDEKC